MKKLESLKLKKFKMQQAKGGRAGGPVGPITGIDPYTYGAGNTYNGTQYVTDTVITDVNPG